MKLELTAGPSEKGLRLDSFISGRCDDLSRSHIQRIIKSGGVSVNEKAVKASWKMEEGDVVSFEVPEASEPEITAEEMMLDIIYEDKDIILINKPKGMVVHPAAGHYSGTLVNG